MKKKSIGHRLIIEWGKPLEPTGYFHKYGGLPSNRASLPLCQRCKKPFHLLLQIDLTDPDLTYLELPVLDFLFLFTCLNCASYEEVMYYRLNNRGQQIVVLQQTPGVYVGEYPVPLEEQKVSHRLLRENEYPKTKEDERRLLSQERKHQLGGAPLWIQDVEHISCVECGKEMEYIAMVDTELYIGEDGFRERGHMFGDSGTLYTFVCRECGLFASQAQGL
jgi:uncharacterized protein YwqG